MNIHELAEIGYVCGLATMREALCQVECHWDAFPPGTLDKLYADIDRAATDEIGADTLCVHVLGEERCRQIDAELDATFARLSESGEADDTSFEWPPP